MITKPDAGKRSIPDSSKSTTVAICICTYRRPAGLQRLLEGLAAQTFPNTQPPAITVIVADNDGNPETRKICDRFRQSGLSLVYIHEPQQGISHARNACLDNMPAGTDFIAMIDDDEAPSPHWLNHLLLAQSHSGADVIVGPTLPVFEEDTPHWVQDSGFFDKPRNPGRYSDLQADPPAATCNVLVNAAIFSSPRHMRFDPELTFSGGEDTLLFLSLKQQGYRTAWAAGARVAEFIPRERANFAYMWKEAYRRGSVRYYVKRRLKAPTPLRLVILVQKLLLRAVTQILTGSHQATTQLASVRKNNRAKLVTHILDIAIGLGTIAGLLRIKSRHYR